MDHSSQGGKPVTYFQGTEVTITTDYAAVGNKSLIALSYKSLASHVKQGGRVRSVDRLK